MPRSLASKQARLAQHASEMMVAAPQVIAHRMAQMAMGRPLAPGSGDFEHMTREKMEAAAEAWNGMGTQFWRSGMDAWNAYAQAWWKAWMDACFPWMNPGSRARFPRWGMTPGQLQHAALDMLDKGMAPVRRRAVSNARRIGKRKRRRQA